MIIVVNCSQGDNIDKNFLKNQLLLHTLPTEMSEIKATGTSCKKGVKLTRTRQKRAFLRRLYDLGAFLYMDENNNFNNLIKFMICIHNVKNINERLDDL